MSLRSAALFAFIGLLLLAILQAFEFVFTMVNVARGLVPAIKLVTSFVQFFASAALTVFLYVFQRGAQ